MLWEDFEKQRDGLLQIVRDGSIQIRSKGQALRDLLESLCKDADSPDELFCPKTPLPIRTTKKRPHEPTIFEDDEIGVEAKVEVLPVESRPIRSSRAAARNASIKMKSQQQALNKKMRRPSTPTLLNTTLSLATASKRQRRQQQNSIDDCSFATALDGSVDKPLEVIKAEILSPSSDSQCCESSEDNNMNELMDLAVHLANPKQGKKTKNRFVKVRKTNITRISVTINSPDIFSDDDDSLPLASLVPNMSLRKDSRKDQVAMVVCNPLTPNTVQRYQPSELMSVKKRVEQFEKLTDASPLKAAEAVAEPVGRITRTRTRAMAVTAQKTSNLTADSSLLKKMARKSLNRAVHTLNNKNKINQEILAEKENDVMKPLPLILTSSKNPKMTPLTNKPNRQVLNSANQNSSSTRNINNIVTGVDTFITKANVSKPVSVEETEEKRREELRKRQEKEDEAIRKRKELQEMQAEEKKRKNEEKRLKVLQSREAIEREKMEQLSRAEREKEDRLRQQLEREQDQREKMLKKRAAAQLKFAEAEERRRNEEAARLLRIKEQEEEQRKLQEKKKKEAEEAEIQMAKRRQVEQQAELHGKKQQADKSKAPLNSTFTLDASQSSNNPKRLPLRVAGPEDFELLDCTIGDSDDEDQRPNLVVPTWSTGKMLNVEAKLQGHMPMQVLRAFFESRPCTPDLSAMFNNPKLKLMKRTSSALWRKPARFSFMPQEENLE